MRVLAMVIAVSVVSGCHKPRPSLEYSEAQNAWSVAVARQGDEAYLDPEMERIEALLAKVAPDSADAAAAHELAATIATERRRVIAEEAARQTAMERALAPVAMPDSPRADPVAEQAAEVGSGSSDAGDEQSFPPGMTVAEMIAASGGCFEAGDQITVRAASGDSRAQVYALRATSGCRQRLSGFVDRVLVIQEGKVLTSAPSAELKPSPAAAPPAAPPPAPPPAPPTVVDAGPLVIPAGRIAPGAPREDYDGGH